MHLSTIISILVCISGAVSTAAVSRNDRHWNKFVTYKYPHLSPTMSPLDGPSGREPTCEELRAMWHFSKRQSRITELTNEVPMYKDPFAYNIWEPYVQSRALGNDILNRGRDYVYGRVVHYPQYPEAPQARQKYSAYDEVVRLLERSTYRKPSPYHASAQQSSPHYKSFERLKNIIRAERAQERQQQQEQQQQVPVNFQTVGGTPDYYVSEDSGYQNDVYGARNYGSTPNTRMQPMIYGVPNEAIYTDPMPSGMYRAEDQYLMVPQTNDNLYNDRSRAYMYAV